MLRTVHPGRVRHWCGSHGKLEPVRHDTSRSPPYRLPTAQPGPAARTNLLKTGIRTASAYRSEAPQREGSDGPSTIRSLHRHATARSGGQIEVTVHAPLLTCFLAKLAVGSDRGDHRRGGGDDAANRPLRRPPVVTANRSAAAYSHPAEPPPCAVCRHRLPAVHRCRVALGLLPRRPDPAGGLRRLPMDPAGIPRLSSAAKSGDPLRLHHSAATAIPHGEFSTHPARVTTLHTTMEDS